MAVTYMTADGYKKLVEDLYELESIQRPAISKQIAEARDKGDLSENAEYDAAKEAQGMLEMKISLLKETIASARLIDESKINTNEVQIMTRAKIKNTKTGQIMTYMIVSESQPERRKIIGNNPHSQRIAWQKNWRKSFDNCSIRRYGIRGH